MRISGDDSAWALGAGKPLGFTSTGRGLGGGVKGATDSGGRAATVAHPSAEFALYHDEGDITIHHADCVQALWHMILLQGQCDPSWTKPDLILTDPPYNAGMNYGQHDDLMDPKAYIAWCQRWFEMTRLLCHRTIVFPGHGNLPVWWSIRKPSAIGCWHKPGANGQSVIGFVDWEPWLYWTGDKGILGGSSVVTASVGKDGESDHPCPKPVALMEKLLLKTKATCVLDPFMGSGTTLRAAKNLGIRAIGIEIEERYCEIAVQRLGQEVLDVAA